MLMSVATFWRAVGMGLAATIVMDGWNLLLLRAFGVKSLNYCLLGRWLSHMPGGRFTHASIAQAPAKRFECAVGYVAHYSIGVGFGIAFMIVAPVTWSEQPALLPALLFGIITVVFPFFVMQPAIGLGIASSKAPKPAQARLKSLTTHTAFGIGLYLSALAMAAVMKP